MSLKQAKATGAHRRRPTRPRTAKSSWRSAAPVAAARLTEAARQRAVAPEQAAVHRCDPSDAPARLWKTAAGAIAGLIAAGAGAAAAADTSGRPGSYSVSAATRRAVAAAGRKATAGLAALTSDPGRDSGHNERPRVGDRSAADSRPQFSSFLTKDRSNFRRNHAPHATLLVSQALGPPGRHGSLRSCMSLVQASAARGRIHSNRH